MHDECSTIDAFRDLMGKRSLRVTIKELAEGTFYVSIRGLFDGHYQLHAACDADPLTRLKRLCVDEFTTSTV